MRATPSSFAWPPSFCDVVMALTSAPRPVESTMRRFVQSIRSRPSLFEETEDLLLERGLRSPMTRSPETETS